MILQIDNNLPPFLAATLNPLAELDGHHVRHIRDRYSDEEHATGVSDERWMSDLASEPDAAFLTLDVHIRKRPLEIAAFKESGLVGFWLRARTWERFLTRRQHHELAWRLLKRWPDIVDAVRLLDSQALEIPLKGKIRGLR